MINLLGCKKEDFFKLLELMHYKNIKTKSIKEELFSYQPKYKKNNKEKKISKKDKNNPFDKLSELRFT